MEFKNENQDTRLQDALDQIEALKAALITAGTLTEENISTAITEVQNARSGAATNKVQ
jgi:hypothetical protein